MSRRHSEGGEDGMAESRNKTMAIYHAVRCVRDYIQYVAAALVRILLLLEEDND